MARAKKRRTRRRFERPTLDGWTVLNSALSQVGSGRQLPVKPRDVLRTEVAECGGVRKAAVSLGVSKSLVSAALLGKRAYGPKLLKALGFKRVVVRG